MFDQPFVRDSFIRQIDPRMRVLLAVLLAVALALLQQVTACCLALGLGCVLLGLARAPLRPLWQRLAAVNMFILFLWLVTPWTTPGTVVWQWHFIQVSREGLYLSLLVTLKSNAIACVFLSLVATLPAATLGHALERLGCPDKLVFLFLFTGRYIHLLAAEWEDLVTAARLRGFRPRTDLHTYRTVASLLGLLLVRSHERAQRTHEAMRLRGFSGRFHSLDSFCLRPVDICFALATASCLACILWTEAGGSILWAGR